jgi:hypothetical protein
MVMQSDPPSELGMPPPLPRGVAICSKVPEDVQEAALQVLFIWSCVCMLAKLLPSPFYMKAVGFFRRVK